MIDISQQYVRERLDYDPDTGVLTWRKRPVEHFIDARSCNSWNSRFAGVRAGHTDQDSYRKVLIDGRPHYAHRLIFLYMVGRLPDLQIDHIDHNKDNNRWDNLREVTQEVNGRNQKLCATNKSGACGVFWAPGRRKWRAYVRSKGKSIIDTHFASFSDAKAAVAEARKEHNFHENHGEQHVV